MMKVSKHSIRVRQQNKILLSLSNEKKDFHQCPKCGYYLSRHHYTHFLEYIWQNDYPKTRYNRAYTFYIRNAGATYIINRDEIEKLPCFFCCNGVQPYLSQFLNFYHKSYLLLIKPRNKLTDYLDTPPLRPNISTTRHSFKENEIDTKFFFSLKYLHECFPHNIYTITIDDKRYQDYTHHHWYSFIPVPTKPMTICIHNENHDPVHKLVL